MAIQLPAENLEQPKAQDAVAGGVAAGLNEIAGNIWKEIGEGIAAGAAKGAMLGNRINHQEIQFNQPGEGKVGLNTGAILSRSLGRTDLGSGQFSINPPVGWHMQFDKAGPLVDAQGVKKIGSEHGVATYLTRDGQTVIIDAKGPLKIKDGKGNITSFSRGGEAANDLKLPKLQLNEKKADAKADGRVDGKAPEKLFNGKAPEKLLDGKAPEKLFGGKAPEKLLDGKAPEKLLNGKAPEKLLDGKKEKGGAMEPARRSYETPFDGNGRSTMMKDGTLFRQYLDGTIVMHSNDGSRTKLSPNGLLTISENGKTHSYNLKDAKSVMFKDGGSVGYYFPDGTNVVMKHRIADGGKFDTGVVITRPSGQSLETYSHMTNHVDYTPPNHNLPGKKRIGK